MRLLWAGLVMCVVGACGGGGCPVEPSEAGAATITEFSIASQLDGDPWTVIFGVGFTDSEGDLSGGTAEFFLNGRATKEEEEEGVPLIDLFRQTGLAEDATSGRFGIPLRFAETVSDGATVNISLQLLDESGARSVCAELDLKFDVEELARIPRDSALGSSPLNRVTARLDGAPKVFQGRCS